MIRRCSWAGWRGGCRAGRAGCVSHWSWPSKRVGWSPPGWGVAEGPMPAFDPLGAADEGALAAPGRRTPCGGGGAGRGVARARCGSGPLTVAAPRLVEDRTVPAGRRNYLAPADLRGLRAGVWVEVGPYTTAEWLARGVAGAAGVGAFLRVTDRSYLAVYETKGGARVADGDRRPGRPQRAHHRRRRRQCHRRQGRRPGGALGALPGGGRRTRITDPRESSPGVGGGCRLLAGATTAPNGGCSTSGCTW